MAYFFCCSLLVLLLSVTIYSWPCYIGEYQIRIPSGVHCRKCPNCPAMMEPLPKCGNLYYMPKLPVCEFCPTGTYKQYRGPSRCVKCSRCLDNQIVVRQCAKDRDILCGDCKKGYCLSADNIECTPCLK